MPLATCLLNSLAHGEQVAGSVYTVVLSGTSTPTDQGIVAVLTVPVYVLVDVHFFDLMLMLTQLYIQVEHREAGRAQCAELSLPDSKCLVSLVYILLVSGMCSPSFSIMLLSKIWSPALSLLELNLQIMRLLYWSIDQWNP